MDYNKISLILERYRILLYNSLSNENIKTAVANHGYDETKMKEGILLYKETVKLLSTREASMVNQVNATLLFNNELLSTKEQFQNIVTICRRVFNPMPEGLKLLPVSTNIPDFDSWCTTVNTLYNGILASPQLLSSLKKYEFTEEKFRQEIKTIVLLKKLNKIQKIKNADLQNKTALRDQKLKELKDFCNTYQDVATKALMKQPMLLEKIGIKVLKKYLIALRPPKAPTRKYKKRTPGKE
jgi:hypothetical protein